MPNAAPFSEHFSRFRPQGKRATQERLRVLGVQCIEVRMSSGVGSACGPRKAAQVASKEGSPEIDVFQGWEEAFNSHCSDLRCRSRVDVSSGAEGKI